MTWNGNGNEIMAMRDNGKPYAIPTHLYVQSIKVTIAFYIR